MKKMSIAVIGVGMGCIAAYLNVNGESSTFLWIGVFFCFVSLVDG